MFPSTPFRRGARRKGTGGWRAFGPAPDSPRGSSGRRFLSRSSPRLFPFSRRTPSWGEWRWGKRRAAAPSGAGSARPRTPAPISARFPWTTCARPWTPSGRIGRRSGSSGRRCWTGDTSGAFRRRSWLPAGGGVPPASVRADLVDWGVAGILSASGHRTITLAPEAGSEELRARIGKRVADGVFFSAARTLARAGIVSFKLYFLCGIPGAGGDEEVEGAVDFLAAFRREVLAEAKSVGRMGTVTAVISPFVPKPFTPLQWAPMAREEDLRGRQRGVSAGVRSLPNVRLRADSPRSSPFPGYLGLSGPPLRGGR